MAKPETTKVEKAAAEKAKAEKARKAEEEKCDYGVPELAEELDIKEASVRIRLRNAEVPKAGKSYGWKTQKEFEAIVKQLTPAKAEKK